jgi:hypothetical protein
MKTALTTIIAAAAILGLALVSPAAAETVSYTVGGYWGQFPGPVNPAPEGAPFGPNGYPGDVVDLQTYTGTLDLVPGTYILKINTLLWTVNYTYAGTEDCWDWPDCWPELEFALNPARSMSVGTANGNLDQAGLLEVDWDDDYLSFASGSTTTFSVGTHLVHVTPLAVDRTSGLNGALVNQSPQERITYNDPPYLRPAIDIYAEFVVEEAKVSIDPMTWGAIKELYR